MHIYKFQAKVQVPYTQRNVLYMHIYTYIIVYMQNTTTNKPTGCFTMYIQCSCTVSYEVKLLAKRNVLERLLNVQKRVLLWCVFVQKSPIKDTLTWNVLTIDFRLQRRRERMTITSLARSYDLTRPSSWETQQECH